MSFLKTAFAVILLFISATASAKIIEFNATFTVDSATGNFDGADNEVSAKFFVDDSYGQNSGEDVNITRFEFILNGQNLGSDSSYWTTTQQAKFWNDSTKTTTTPFTYIDPTFNNVTYQTSDEQSLPSYFKASVVGSGNADWQTGIRGKDNELIGMAQGSFAITERVSAVPEPSSLVLFLGGLGILGFITYRRKGRCTL